MTEPQAPIRVTTSWLPVGVMTTCGKRPRRAGPARADLSSVVWVYHSHTANVIGEIQAGLSGVLVIVRKGKARYDSRGRPYPRDVDREFVNLYAVFDENRSIFLDDNRAAHSCDDTCGLEEGHFEESNLMHGINGLLWDKRDAGGAPLYEVEKGDKVRMYIGALGSEVDLHTPHLHGVTMTDHGGHRTDVPEILPGAFKVYDMTADNAGEWIYHCHVEDHVAAGMVTTVTITD